MVELILVDEDEIDLLELFRILLHKWKTIVGVAIICRVGVVYSLYAQRYSKRTLLAPASEEKSVASSALSQLVDWLQWREYLYLLAQILAGSCHRNP